MWHNLFTLAVVIACLVAVATSNLNGASVLFPSLDQESVWSPGSTQSLSLTLINLPLSAFVTTVTVYMTTGDGAHPFLFYLKQEDASGQLKFDVSVPEKLPGGKYNIKALIQTNEGLITGLSSVFLVDKNAGIDPAIQFTAPTKNFVWQVEQSFDIQYTINTVTPPSSVRLELWDTNDATIVTSSIEENYRVEALSYQWTIPTSVLGGDKYYVRIVASYADDREISGFSPMFSIINPDNPNSASEQALNFIFPTERSKIIIGSSYDIRWKFEIATPPPFVNVELWSLGFQSIIPVQVIASNISSSRSDLVGGVVTWVPNKDMLQPGESYAIRVWGPVAVPGSTGETIIGEFSKFFKIISSNGIGGSDSDNFIAVTFNTPDDSTKWTATETVEINYSYPAFSVDDNAPQTLKLELWKTSSIPLPQDSTVSAQMRITTDVGGASVDNSDSVETPIETDSTVEAALVFKIPFEAVVNIATIHFNQTALNQGEGRLKWKIPAIIDSGTNYFIRGLTTFADGTQTAGDSSRFEIVGIQALTGPQSIQILFPAPNSVWFTDSSYDISWKLLNLVGPANVNIELWGVLSSPMKTQSSDPVLIPTSPQSANTTTVFIDTIAKDIDINLLTYMWEISDVSLPVGESNLSGNEDISYFIRIWGSYLLEDGQLVISNGVSGAFKIEEPTEFSSVTAPLKKMWRTVRKMFKRNSPRKTIIKEIEWEKFGVQSGEMVIFKQLNRLAKKMKVKRSVDKNLEVVGY
ncbi:hypothetical protein BKA69DRAFT_1046889 [Paraphysoderma sedebokerense]|nr:hypothetical protein BKA69DRAFT_1046889 [Paraphysoderma sedebokerense]